jgi:mannitol 2-dehydrogenase
MTLLASAVPLRSSLLRNPPAGLHSPRYDRARVREGWVHLGAGAFHRSHQALYLDELLEAHGERDWAICGVGIMPQDEAMDRAMRAQDGLYTLVERMGDERQARVIGALTSYIYGWADPERVFAKLADPNVRIVSLTATEGGYCFDQHTGALDFQHPGIQNDLRHPNRPQTIFGYLAEGLDRRRRAGGAPFTALSCDNLQGNGHILRRTLLAFCEARDAELARWIEARVAFPNCMVDRITPVTTDLERGLVRAEFGIDDAAPVVAEPFRQWVIEDAFCDGRPPLEKVGVQFTSDVAPYEKMKLRLLNATHSAMGYLGYLCGYRYIYEIARAPEFVPYLTALMDEEVTPLLDEVPGIDLSAYKATLMQRFANETIKDQALRICMDGSAKIPKFILPSIAEQLARGGNIRRLTLCVAAWFRFLAGVDEGGREIPLVDGQAERLVGLARVSRGDPRALLALTDLFGTLGQSPRFVEELTFQLTSLHEHGARATLAAVLAST